MTDARAAFEAFLKRHGDPSKLSDPMREILHLVFEAGQQHEREACAKVCEDYGASYDNEWNRKLGVANDLKDACDECAAAIRARSEPS